MFKGKSIQVKHLHLIRCKVLSSGQDCVTVLYSTWNRVRNTKGWQRISVTFDIVSNDDVVPRCTKCWTATWPLVNCIWWVLHHALKWSKTFIVAKRKYERIGSGTITIIRFWKKKNIRTEKLMTEKEKPTTRNFITSMFCGVSYNQYVAC